MQPTIRRWPDAPAYFPALSTPVESIRDKRLHRLSVEPHPAFGDRVPFGRYGRFGSVFKFTGNNKSFALKVFVRDVPKRQLRYRLIGEHLGTAKPPTTRLISFKYHERGILVGSNWYPALVMDWSSGMTFDQYLTKWLNSRRRDNAQLCREWVRTVQELKSRKIAHGDLQHENILVKGNGTFQLIDYDGMFVPKMLDEKLLAAEVGRPAYQHPARSTRPHNTDYFDERLDDFSALVILLSLAAVDASLWRAHHDDDRLIISEQDLREPSKSPLLATLARRPGPVATLTDLLVGAATSAIEAVPPFEKVIAKPDVQAWLNNGTNQRPPTRPTTLGALPPGLLPERPTDAVSPARRTAISRSQTPTSRAGQELPKARRAPTPEPTARKAATPEPTARKAATPELTAREVAVARLLAEGLSAKEIADQFALALKTVAGYVRSLRTKTGSDSTEALTAWARAQYPPPPKQQVAKPPPSPTKKAHKKSKAKKRPDRATTEVAAHPPSTPRPRETPAEPAKPLQLLPPGPAEELPDLSELFRKKSSRMPDTDMSQRLSRFINPALSREISEAARLTAEGEEHLRTGNSQEALRAFDQALAKRSQHVPALVGRAEARRRMRRFQEALRDVNQALRLQPGNPRALQVRSDTNRDTGRTVRAWADQVRARWRGGRTT